MSYFTKESKKKNKYITERRRRPAVIGLRRVFQFVIGDVLAVYFANRGTILSFVGLCIAIKNKSFRSSNTAFTLRNILSSIAVESIFGFFEARVFTPTFYDYKRKKFHYNRSKLYFLRNKLNRYSRVK